MDWNLINILERADQLAELYFKDSRAFNIKELDQIETDIILIIKDCFYESNFKLTNLLSSYKEYFQQLYDHELATYDSEELEDIIYLFASKFCRKLEDLHVEKLNNIDSKNNANRSINVKGMSFIQGIFICYVMTCVFIIKKVIVNNDKVTLLPSYYVTGQQVVKTNAYSYNEVYELMKFINVMNVNGLIVASQITNGVARLIFDPGGYI